MDDVVVVGGRCAGAPTAMLLARAGLTVRLVERATSLGDVVSGHMIKSAGAARLQAWGLLGRVLDTGCPPITSAALWRDGHPNPLPPVAGALPPLAPRRTALDAVLLDAAREAGVQVELGTAVAGIRRRAGRVTGVETSAGPRPARLVVGADGRHSRVARLVGATAYQHVAPVTCSYYTYWRGMPAGGLHVWAERNAFIGMFPTHGHLHLVFIQVPHREFGMIRQCSRAYYEHAIRQPGLAGLVGSGVIAEALRGTGDLPTFFRTSAGPGWVLAGDAGHHKDPLIARGITDAFRDAGLITAAATAGWDSGLDEALAAYPAARDARARPLSDANLAVAALNLDAAELGQAWLALVELERIMDSGEAPGGASAPKPGAKIPVSRQHPHLSQLLCYRK
jgi:2-polyprenyl-6-methoxyphenol hydroxylase-like FAD-dependent oxidoreductase